MTILAIDPGPTESAYVVTNGVQIFGSGKVPNHNLLRDLRSNGQLSAGVLGILDLAIEQIRGYGLRVGNETFDTCTWSGRFDEAWDGDVYWLARKTIVTNLCATATAGDKFIRQAIIDRFGGLSLGIGTKKEPGPLRGVAGDVWSALAVALTWLDLRRVKAL